MTETAPPASGGEAANPKGREVEQLYPLLTWHYQLPPSELVLMPRNLKQVYLDALPGLVAGEQLRALEASAYPHMEERDQHDVQRRWREQMPGGDRQPEGYAPKDLDELKLLVATRGIGVVVEPGKRKTAPDGPGVN